MNLRVFFIYICKTAHFGWLRSSFFLRLITICFWLSFIGERSGTYCEKLVCVGYFFLLFLYSFI